VSTIAAIAAMTCVGGSIAVSQALVNAPVLTAQALRYALASGLLAGLARITGRALPRPRGVEWWWLIGVAGTGLALFNVAVVRAVDRAEPAVVAVAMSCVPVLLAVIGPVLTGHRPAGRVVLAAVVVTAGAVLVEGTGRTDGVGALWAVVVMTCEAAFTLLAVPVLGRLGAWAVSAHTTWIAAALLVIGGVGFDGPLAVGRLTGHELLAIGYLAVVMTALAFVLWYSAVGRLGPGRTGLLTGVAPMAAAGAGVLLGGPAPVAGVWLGIAIVVTGLALGLSHRDVG
jgi:drug/metabolite transporter (DMT)-like permease